jgi:hypothetical protein
MMCYKVRRVLMVDLHDVKYNCDNALLSIAWDGVGDWSH